MLTKTAGSVKTRYSYNAANQLVSDGTFDYTYDKVGNLLKKQSDGGSVSYAYNARNLLESWTDGEHSESYCYNASGLLSTVTTAASTTSLTWDILYGEGVVISEKANDTVTDYTYGLERISASTGKTRTEYVYDARGSVIAEVSKAGLLSGTKVTTRSYTPFGEQIGEASSGFGWNGEYYNATTGMVYLRARFYEPEMNRFSQKDILRGSMTTPQTLNRYVYCGNDPINRVDPSGMKMVTYQADGGGGKTTPTAPKPANTGRVSDRPTPAQERAKASAAQTAQNVRVQNRLDQLDERDSGKTADSSSASQTKNHVEQQARENGTSNGKENTKQACSSAPEVESANENDTPNCNSQDDMEKVKQIPEEQLKNDSVYQILYPEKGVVGYGISGTAGLGLDVGFSIMYVLDESRNGKWAVSFGIGGGLGGSFGITTYENREIVSIDEMEGSGTSVGGTIIMIGMEGDSSKGMSASVWKPSLGAEFHALINYTFVWE